MTQSLPKRCSAVPSRPHSRTHFIAERKSPCKGILATQEAEGPESGLVPGLLSRGDLPSLLGAHGASPELLDRTCRPVCSVQL